MKINIRSSQLFISVFIGCLLFIVAGLLPAEAANRTADVVIDVDLGKPINLTLNKLGKLKSQRMIARALVVNPAVAEIFKPTSADLVLIAGKSIGTTQLTIWDKNNTIIGTYEVIVGPDLSELKKTYHEIFPGENIEVRSTGEFLTLSGTVTSAEKIPKILELARAYAPVATAQMPDTKAPSTQMQTKGQVSGEQGKIDYVETSTVGENDKEGKVINLLQVGGVQQVMLEVRVAEISKSLGNQLGVNFAIQGNDAFGLSLLDNLTAIPEEGWPGNPIMISNSINAVLGFISGDTLIFSIDALQEDGLLQILAKPTLIAQSGQSASFLAGGEFPYPVASTFDRFSIEWKPFGIGLNFTPTVLGNDTISLVVSPEVSDLDFTKTVSFAGYVVPSIDTRRMSTVVELKDNQSFAIAGLLKNYVRESIKKFPLLGDIPVLGALFRSTRYQKDETELLVIVTPHLVKPADAAALPLPTDSFEDPTPFEILMLGMMEKWHDPERQGGNPTAQTWTKPSMEGDFGYIIPE